MMAWMRRQVARSMRRAAAELRLAHSMAFSARLGDGTEYLLSSSASELGEAAAALERTSRRDVGRWVGVWYGPTSEAEAAAVRQGVAL